MRNLMALLIISIALVSCNGGSGGGSGGYVYTSKVDSFINLLNNNANYGDRFYVVKDQYESMTEGFVVVYSPSSGYTAYDIASYMPGDSWYQYSSRAEYGPVYIHGVENDAYGETFYFGDAYTNSYYPTYRGEFVFDESTENSKDLEKAAAIKEMFNVTKAASTLATEFGLSEERSEKVARLAYSWKNMAKKRSMTDADANSFSKDVLGVDLKTAAKAIEGHLKGDQSAFDQVIKTAAKTNGTSPEQMSELLEKVLAE